MNWKNLTIISIIVIALLVVSTANEQQKIMQTLAKHVNITCKNETFEIYTAVGNITQNGIVITCSGEHTCVIELPTTYQICE